VLVFVRTMGWLNFSKYPTSWIIILEWLIGNVVISETDALIYVVLSKAGKHVPYGDLVGTTECLTLYTRCRTNRGCYNGVQLYL